MKCIKWNSISLHWKPPQGTYNMCAVDHSFNRIHLDGKLHSGKLLSYEKVYGHYIFGLGQINSRGHASLKKSPQHYMSKQGSKAHVIQKHVKFEFDLTQHFRYHLASQADEASRLTNSSQQPVSHFFLGS